MKVRLLEIIVFLLPFVGIAASTTTGAHLTSQKPQQPEALGWHCWDKDNPNPCHDGLYDVSMFAANNGWAVGANGTTLHWNGSHWRRIANPIENLGDSLNAVDAVAPNDAWTVGGTIMHWNGANWTELLPPTNYNLQSVSMTATDDGWAVGVRGTMLRWNGATWNEVAGPTTETLEAVDMISGTDGWAVGRGGVILHWNGTTWTQISSPTTQRLQSVAMISATDGWAVGGEHAYHWNGSTWTAIGGPFSYLEKVVAVASDNVWATDGNEIYHWDGAAWMIVPKPPSNSINSLDLIGEQTGWAVGDGGTMLRWDGIAWSIVTDPVLGRFRDVDMLSASDGWAVGTVDGMLHWNGADWIEVDNPAGPSLLDIDMYSSTTGWAVGMGGSIIRWNGSQWTSVYSPTSLTLSGVATLSPTEAWAVGGDAYSNRWVILRFNGSQWSVYFTGAGRPLTAISMSSSTDGWAAGRDGKLMHWNGVNWNLVASPTNLTLYDIDMWSASSGWAVGGDEYGGNGVLLRWNGSSWTEVDNPVFWNIDGVQMVSSTEAWAVGGRGTILHWSGSGWNVVPSPNNQSYTAVAILPGDGWIVGGSSSYTAASILRYYEPTSYDYDLGFRPDPDGYSFDNYGGVNSTDYTIEDMVRMFGQDAICVNDGPGCIPRTAARQWNAEIHETMAGGHCEGMSVSSLRFFRGLDDPTDYLPWSEYPYGLSMNAARRNIAYWFVPQLTSPVSAIRRASLGGNTPNDILDQLQTSMEGLALNPYNLAIFYRPWILGEWSGHAITPYALDDLGNGIWRVYVYDNNHEGDSSRFLTINTTTNSWSYDLGPGLGVWDGDAGSHTIGLVPLGAYSLPPTCRWCAPLGNSPSTAEETVISSGPGQLLISNASGERVGFDGGVFVNEIEGAWADIPVGGLGVPAEPFYILPPAEYTILLDGQTATENDASSLARFGPGYAVSARDISVGPLTRDLISMSADGTQLSYHSETGAQLVLTMALEQAQESLGLQILKGDVNAGQSVTMTADLNNDLLLFDNSNAGGGDYGLSITQAAANSWRVFRHSLVTISPTDTHQIDFGSWLSNGSMLLHIDHGSDGTIDETVELENQAPRLFLPLVNVD